MNAIQIISLQHELGMSIGLDMKLKVMLKEFTKVCIRQLGLSSVHYYILQTEDGNAVLPSEMLDSEIQHFLSIPKASETNHKCGFSSAVKQVSSADLKLVSVHDKKSNEYIYYLSLGEIGVVVFHRFDRVIDDIIFDLLKPIFKRLTVSCQASIEHEHLLHAVKARKKAEEALSHLAFHDELTNLPNRRLFMENLTKDLSYSNKHGFLGAVLFLDLNRFKVINDTLGHATGDQLLIAVARILKSIVRKEDTVARLSGDEFVIQFPKVADNEVDRRAFIQVVLDEIHHFFSKPIKAGEHTLHVTPSIGVEMYPNGDASADDILHHADTAMYQAKTRGANTSSFYDKQLSYDLKLRLELEKELQIAVKNTEQFELVYQPQYTSDGVCIGAEALIRWNNPERGVISPAEFIPIAEETGLMLEIGNWVIVQSCEHLAGLYKLGIPKAFDNMSINISAMQLSQENFVLNILNVIKNKGVPPNLLSIELTESSLIKNIDEVIYIISTLREQGITTSIDDFGTGYSSLSYLSRLPIETLKIDQAFVRDIHSDKGNHAIVNAIMALGKSLNLNIIAEGVETTDELACLKELGCKSYQGYYFSKPISHEEFSSLMRDQANLP